MVAGKYSRFPVLRNPADPVAARIQQNISNVLAPVAQAIQNTPILGAPPPPWQLPTLLNGFTFLYTGTLAKGTGFAKDALGYVWCNVTARNSSGGPAAAGTPIFRFPVGYRPVTPMGFACNAHTSVDPVDLGIDGTVSDGSNIPNGSHIHLCFSFLAES